MFKISKQNIDFKIFYFRKFTALIRKLCEEYSIQKYD